MIEADPTLQEEKLKFFICVFALATGGLFFNGSIFGQSRYFQFGHLNQADVDVDSQWTELRAGTHTFSKSSGSTTVEVYANSRFGAHTIDSKGVRYQVRVDGTRSTFDNEGSLDAVDPSNPSHLARKWDFTSSKFSMRSN